ncbi:hypothetical protein G6F40_014512 [Rhizopus arrhizus]|nr:hypothetical protein G6F40_014512 [Rhizopus arrhizus]
MGCAAVRRRVQGLRRGPAGLHADDRQHVPVHGVVVVADTHRHHRLHLRLHRRLQALAQTAAHDGSAGPEGTGDRAADAQQCYRPLLPYNGRHLQGRCPAGGGAGHRGRCHRQYGVRGGRPSHARRCLGGLPRECGDEAAQPVPAHGHPDDRHRRRGRRPGCDAVQGGRVL